MLIECTIKRPGGSVVELFGVDYHFVPAIDGRHVCDVAAPEAVERFLQIPEGYRVALATSILADDAPTQVELKPVSPWNAQQGPGDELPEGAPTRIADMTREQLLAYAQKLGMRRPHPNMRDDRLRAEVELYITQRAEAEAEEREEMRRTAEAEAKAAADAAALAAAEEEEEAAQAAAAAFRQSVDAPAP